MGVILSGFLLRVYARGHKEDKCSNGKSLVKDGPYAVIRNPMYFGTFLIGTGVVIMLLQPWTFFVFSAVFFMIYIPQMRKEEKALLERFGDEYKAYCSVTSAHIPNLKSSGSFLKYFFPRYSWIKKELSSFLILVVTVVVIEIWQDSRLFGSKEILLESVEQLAMVLFFVGLIALFIFKKKRVS